MIRKLILGAALCLAALLASPASAAPASISIADAQCIEGQICAFKISKSPASSYSKISVQIHSGTAIAGKDYVAQLPVILSLPNGAGSRAFNVSTLDNSILDGSRSFTITIAPLRNTAIARGTAAGLIKDDEVAPPPPPATQTCPDGTVIPAASQCPAPPPPPTQTCWDGSLILASAQCPPAPPPPAPTPPAGWLPSPSLDGAVAIPSVADPALALQPSWGKGSIPASAAPDVVGAFRFICTAGQVLADDPIVYPGQPGKSHLHQFYGNESANAFSTFASLRSVGTSTCNRGPFAANRSAYWMPAMLDANEQVVKPAFVAIYYKRRMASDAQCSAAAGTSVVANVGPKAGQLQTAEGKCIPIPNGLKFIFGYDLLTAKSPTGGAWFNCKTPDGKPPIPGVVPGHYLTITQAAANCPAGAQLGAIIVAPRCWNGTDLDSPNHRDHVAYPVPNRNTGQIACPPTHPYVIPDFTLGAWYPVAAGMHLSSDAMVPGAAPGTTFHADYFEAWDPTVKAMWTDNCINKMLNCGGGDLGNGKQLIGAQ